MKKLVALLLACMMLLTAGVAMAEYTSVKVVNSEGENTTSYPHTLQLTGGISGLDYVIEYTFALQENSLEIMQPSDIVNAQLAVSGTPVINTPTIKYDSTDVFSTENKSLTKEFVVDWSGVEFKEPGVYRWTVNKEVEDTDPTENGPTNYAETFYLFVYIAESSGNLTVGRTNFTTRAGLDEAPENETAAIKGSIVDQYPSELVDLTLSKSVTGTLGSKDQYFAFTVSLNSPTGSASATYNIEYMDGTSEWNGAYEKNAYNSNAGQNPQSVNVSSTSDSFVLYLRHGQSATIKNLPFSSSYTIFEEKSGYTVTNITADGDNDHFVADKDKATASDASMTIDTKVAFTNEKTATVPTGIDLQTGAPLMGLLLAASMLLMLFISKRREAAE